MKLCYAKTWRLYGGHRRNRSTVKLMSCTRADWINFSGQNHSVAWAQLVLQPQNASAKQKRYDNEPYMQNIKIFFFVLPISFFSALGLLKFRCVCILHTASGLQFNPLAGLVNRFWGANAHCASILFIFAVSVCGMRWVGMIEDCYQFMCTYVRFPYQEPYRTQRLYRVLKFRHSKNITETDAICCYGSRDNRHNQLRFLAQEMRIV